jgi:hypothetical protein
VLAEGLAGFAQALTKAININMNKIKRFVFTTFSFGLSLSIVLFAMKNGFTSAYQHPSESKPPPTFKVGGGRLQVIAKMSS